MRKKFKSSKENKEIETEKRTVKAADAAATAAGLCCCFVRHHRCMCVYVCRVSALYLLLLDVEAFLILLRMPSRKDSIRHAFRLAGRRMIHKRKPKDKIDISVYFILSVYIKLYN